MSDGFDFFGGDGGLDFFGDGGGSIGDGATPQAFDPNSVIDPTLDPTAGQFSPQSFDQSTIDQLLQSPPISNPDIPMPQTGSTPFDPSTGVIPWNFGPSFDGGVPMGSPGGASPLPVPTSAFDPNAIQSAPLSPLSAPDAPTDFTTAAPTPGTGGPSATALAGPEAPTDTTGVNVNYDALNNPSPEPFKNPYSFDDGTGAPSRYSLTQPSGSILTGGNGIEDQALRDIVNGSGGSGGSGSASSGGGQKLSGDFFDRALQQIENNPLAAIGVAGALGSAIYGQTKGTPPVEQQLQNLANTQASTGTDLTQSGAAGLKQGAQTAADTGASLLAPLTTGAPLPAGALSQIKSAELANEAAIRSGAASRGTLNSTMTESQIAQARDAAAGQQFDVAKQLAQLGINMDAQAIQQYNALFGGGVNLLGGAQSGYGKILAQQVQDDQAFQEALASLSQALGRFGGGNNGTVPARPTA